MSDDTTPRARRRMRWAVVLLALGFLGAFVPGLAAGGRFLPGPFYELFLRLRPLTFTGSTRFVRMTYQPADVSDPKTTPWIDLRHIRIESRALTDLVREEPGWTAAAATLLVV